jgi:hypothetical protein
MLSRRQFPATPSVLATLRANGTALSTAALLFKNCLRESFMPTVPLLTRTFLTLQGSAARLPRERVGWDAALVIENLT